MEDQKCDCCEGTQSLTPASVANRPGLSALKYRVGTHARFLETMKARLATMQVTVPGPDGAAPTTSYPLSSLTTRLANDPAIALLDGWSTVADVLTFYQERIANEGYLGTATERRSVLELSRLIGYALRPGVAASVFLALDLDKDHRVVIQPYEVKAQSLPGPGELPQTFENIEPLEARDEWNRLIPRSTKPQNITFDNVLTISPVYFQGAALNLKVGDRILFVFGEEIGMQAIRRVQAASPVFDQKYTQVELQPVPFLIVAAVALLRAAQAALDANVAAIRAETDPNFVAGFDEQVDHFQEGLKSSLENLLLGNFPALNDDYFSHDRIYAFLAGQNRGGPFGFLRELNRKFSIFVHPGAPAATPGEGGSPTPPDPGQVEFQKLETLVIKAVLDRALTILEEKAVKRETACLVRDIFERARPATRVEKSMLEEELQSFVKQNQLDGNTVIDLSGLKNQFPELGPQIDRAAGLLVQILTSAEVFNALNDLLNDLLKLPPDPTVTSVIQAVQKWLQATGRGPANGCDPTIQAVNLDDLIAPLAKGPSLQLSSSANLVRSTKNIFQSGADNVSQLVTSITPNLEEILYRAWANARVNAAQSPLKSVYVLRAEAAPFGYNAPLKTGFTKNGDPNTAAEFPFVTQPIGDWSPNDPNPGTNGDEAPDNLFLDAANNAILPKSYILIHNQLDHRILLARVNAALTRPRTAYSVSSKTSQLTLSRKWWDPTTDNMQVLRTTTLALQSEEVFLFDPPYTADVQGATIELDDLYDSLATGRWLIISGERTDLTGTSGVNATELIMISAVNQQFDSSLPGDQTRTVITLYNNLAYTYKRDTVTVYGNVLKATHGETRKETLGSGDASQVFQSFALKQSPLTFTSSPTPAGAESTLQVYVNDVRWYESGSLTTLLPSDRKFVTKTDDAGKTSVIFGNGLNGARLPTAPANIRAQYRYGIGQPGNVQTGKISLLASKPLGVQAVTNPLSASSGADRESRDTARKNAPRTTNALDRLVSVSDYADFARNFAGIGKSIAALLSNSQRQLVHVTIAGVDDIPIDETSDLFNNLLLAMRSFGDPDLPVVLQVRELLLLVLSANLAISADYQWDSVVKAVRLSLLDQFSFENRELGQYLYLSEVISAIQSVPGVEYVDVDVLGGVPEKKAGIDANGNPVRRLLTPSEITDEVQTFIRKSGRKGRPVDRLPVNLADFEESTLRPAQLIYFLPDVTDTLVLNQVK